MEKATRVAVNALSSRPKQLRQRLEAGPVGLCEQLQPLNHEDAVFACQGYDVRNGTDCQ